MEAIVQLLFTSSSPLVGVKFKNNETVQNSRESKILPPPPDFVSLHSQLIFALQKPLRLSRHKNSANAKFAGFASKSCNGSMATCHESFRDFRNNNITFHDCASLDSLDSHESALLIFIFSASLASFGSALFIALFTPVPETRYMSPVLPLSIAALVGFIAWILEAKIHTLNLKCKISPSHTT